MECFVRKALGNVCKLQMRDLKQYQKGIDSVFGEIENMIKFGRHGSLPLLGWAMGRSGAFWDEGKWRENKFLPDGAGKG